jgi:pyruvate dehydrogenase E2 component (dihydrolipoamide acetyltransferase)
MVTKVVMPKLSLTMKEGTVGRWYKKEGDTVDKGEPIVEILSEKATYDLEAPESGILRKILVEEGLNADVDAVLALITAPNEVLPEAEQVAAMPEKIEEVEKRVLASPAARRLAKEHGIDILMVEGSGPEGRVSEDDVRRFIEEKLRPAPKIKKVIPLSGYRKTTAERLSASFKTAPHSTNMVEVDVSEAKRLHERLQVSYTTILVKAVAKALNEHSIINATLEGEKIKIFEDVNIGVAVATENGLVVPVIHNADRKSFEEIEAALKELTEKAKQGRLVRDDVTGGTFTISNLGMYGVEFFTPIINPPEAAILGVGRVAEKPVVVKGNVEVRSVLMLSLSYDHRIVDGVPAAQFLCKVKHFMENPEILVA